MTTMNWTKRERDDEEKHCKDLLDGRVGFESESIMKGDEIDGAMFVGVSHATIDQEQRNVLGWNVWKHRLTVEFILPSNYPNTPPTVRVLDLSGWPPQHPDFDQETGFMRYQFMNDDPWSPAINIRTMFIVVMELFSQLGLPVFEKPAVKPHIRGDYRYRFPLSYNNYHYLTSPFGRSCLRNLEENHPVKFELCGGKQRAMNNQRYLQISTNKEGADVPVKEELRKFFEEQRQRTAVAMASTNCSKSGMDNLGHTTEESGIGDMKGVEASLESIRRPQGRGIGRGRGRGRASFPIYGLPGEQSTTGEHQTTSVPAEAVPGSGNAYPNILQVMESPPKNPPEGNADSTAPETIHFVQKELEEFKQTVLVLACTALDTCSIASQRTESKVNATAARLEGLENSTAIFAAMAGDVIELRRGYMREQRNSRILVSQLRNRWKCPECDAYDTRELMPEKRILVTTVRCAHMVCECCAEEIRCIGFCPCAALIQHALTVYP